MRVCDSDVNNSSATPVHFQHPARTVLFQAHRYPSLTPPSCMSSPALSPLRPLSLIIMFFISSSHASILSLGPTSSLGPVHVLLFPPNVLLSAPLLPPLTSVVNHTQVAHGQSVLTWLLSTTCQPTLYFPHSARRCVCVCVSECFSSRGGGFW